MDKCIDCQTFSTKKISEPIQPHKVPSRCWEKVAVDLFSPMPSSHHVVVVQDLPSHYPSAKIVSSTKAAKVLPALANIYNTLGNPEQQISDNGPPFNSKEMEDFTAKRNISLQKIPPLHPAANPVETFMRPLGKATKIAYHNRTPENDALNQLLMNYHDTPHPATGVAPTAMLFRDAHQSNFPQCPVTEDDIMYARIRDATLKESHQNQVNSSKYLKPSQLNIGDTVLLRNYNKTSKFDPTFQPRPCKIVDTDQRGHFLVIEREADGRIFHRHPDDVKPFTGHFIPNIATDHPLHTEKEAVREWHSFFDNLSTNPENSEDSPPRLATGNVKKPSGMPRTSARTHIPNPRHFNEDFVP